MKSHRRLQLQTDTSRNEAGHQYLTIHRTSIVSPH
ncbi:hypothetical protein X975_04660, partial [Stegodyphus mimosarum]